MSAARLRMVASRNNPNGRIDRVRWISSTKALLNRTTQEPFGRTDPNAKWGVFLLDLSTNREIPFPEHQLYIQFHLPWQHVYSSDLQYVAWFEPHSNHGYIGSITGRLIRSWSQLRWIYSLLWLPDNRTVILQESDSISGESEQDYDKRTVKFGQTARFRYESVDGRASRKIITLPVFLDGSNPISPEPLNSRVAIADNLRKGPWGEIPYDRKKYIAERWLIDRDKPIKQKIAFDLPRGCRFHERAFSSDGEWIAWMLRDEKSDNPKLWISQYHGKEMQPMLSPTDEQRFVYHSKQERLYYVHDPIAWVPDRQMVSFLHEGQLYLIDV